MPFAASSMANASPDIKVPEMAVNVFIISSLQPLTIYKQWASKFVVKTFCPVEQCLGR